jgi:hypothetical protein
MPQSLVLDAIFSYNSDICYLFFFDSMTSRVFANDPFQKTTYVVEYYHILSYKQILQELLYM